MVWIVKILLVCEYEILWVTDLLHFISERHNTLLNVRGDVNLWVILIIPQYVSSFQEYLIHTRLALRYFFFNIFRILVMNSNVETQNLIPFLLPFTNRYFE